MNSDITDTKDARVAEILGWGLIETEDGSWAWVSKDNEGDYAHEAWNNEYAFISAATFASDGIVLEWVQRQGIDYDDRDFYVCLASLVSPEGKEIPLELLAYVRNYKPGMYAHALLAVEEERDDS